MKSESMERLKLPSFTALFVVSQVLGVGVIILVTVWGEALGGYPQVWSPSRVFNWHPLLMVLSLIVIQGDSILIYRALRYDSKPRLKRVHALLHGLAILLVGFGLKAAFDSHNYKEPPIPNMYSLHSWIGMSTVILFGLQLAIGVGVFLSPLANQTLRKTMLSYHVFGGTVIFILSIMTALMGIVEKNIFEGKYSELPAPAVFGNLCGVLIVIFGMTVFYLLWNPDFKRDPLHGE